MLESVVVIAPPCDTARVLQIDEFPESPYGHQGRRGVVKMVPRRLLQGLAEPRDSLWAACATGELRTQGKVKLLP